jgi:hypothetical protein
MNKITDLKHIYNPALEKGIDYLISACRSLKPQYVNLKIHRHPSGSGEVTLELDYNIPLEMIPIPAPAEDTHDPGV